MSQNLKTQFTFLKKLATRSLHMRTNLDSVSQFEKKEVAYQTVNREWSRLRDMNVSPYLHPLLDYYRFISFKKESDEKNLKLWKTWKCEKNHFKGRRRIFTSAGGGVRSGLVKSRFRPITGTIYSEALHNWILRAIRSRSRAWLSHSRVKGMTVGMQSLESFVIKS